MYMALYILCILTAYLTQLRNIERCAHCALLALSHFVFRVFTYSIQGVSGKKSIFRTVTISAVVTKKVHTNICLTLNVYRYRAVWIFTPKSVRFLFVGLDEGRSVQNKGGHTDELLARILDVPARIHKNKKINSDEQHTIFTHELQSVWKLTVGFWNIYCEL